MFLHLQNELQEMIENKVEAETLHAILHVKPRPVDTSNKDKKQFGKRKITGKLFITKKK